MRALFFTTIFSIVFAFEKDMTFTVQAGRTDCFYQKVVVNEVIDLEYQVIDSDHGDLDISFQLSDPVGRVIVADYKKPDNSHHHTAVLEGDYRFCFDNTFSTFSHKTVFFDLVIEPEGAKDKDYDDDNVMELGGNSVETYIMKVQDISESVNRIRDHVVAAKRLQEAISAHEARDRNVMEVVCARVMQWSIIQITILCTVGILQVFFVRSLFNFNDGKS